MAISAINCTPIKPQVAFGNSAQEQFDEINDISDKINDKIVNSDDIKKPVAVAASVALAGLTSWAGARALTSAVTSKFLPKAGVYVETGLKTAANAVKSGADKFAQVTPEKKLSLATVKKYTGKAVASIEEGARNIYKKVAYSGIDEKVVNPERANKALANAAGAGAATITVADICTKDSNGDGITDIMQKSQNAYTGAKTQYGNAFETVGVLSEIAQMFA